MYAIYKCRNCGNEKAIAYTKGDDELTHTFLSKIMQDKYYALATHRCSHNRVGVADLIAVEE